MKQLMRLVIAMALSSLAYATEVKSTLPLDKIVFQLSAKQWVTTSTALLKVSINATLNNADLVKARADIMERLTKIAKGDWHLTAFNRSQDSSGLEKLSVKAEARVAQNTLTDVYKNAKSVSQPGSSYKISGIEFEPSLEETEQVRNTLREQLYQQVNEEIKRINRVYGDQNYSVYYMMFTEGNQPIQPKSFQAREINTMVMAATPPVINVSQELIMTAMVMAASNRSKEN